MTHYSDRESKDVLLTWPQRTRALWEIADDAAWWMMARPKSGRTACPDMRTVGTDSQATQPDGMWIHVCGAAYADVMIIESCGGSQNLSDKRNRYGPSLHSKMLRIPRCWLKERPSSTLPVRWRSIPQFTAPPRDDLLLPIRHLRALFFLSDDLYESCRHTIVPGAHEFFGKHSSMASYSSQAMQRFLARMRRAAHFYTDA